MRKVFVITLIIAVFVVSACAPSNTINEKMIVAVSIPPQVNFVEAVAGDLVEVITMVPPGYSPANYQPTPREMAEFEKSSIYFIMGMPAEETNIIPSIAADSTIKQVHLDEIVGEIYPDRHFEDEHKDEDHEDEDGHSHEGRDPHIWLSPKRVIVMVETIRDELSALDPDNASTYESNAANYIEALEDLDKALKSEFSEIDHPTFLIYHPSLGYLADDYGIEMVALENEGKEATAQGLEAVIDFAKDNEIDKVFYQDEFDSAQAEVLAKEIGGDTVQLSPLAQDYIANMKTMAKALLESFSHGDDH